ncbi:MAG: class I SAM-dependent methyltransferase [Microgenomates group bacterium]
MKEEMTSKSYWNRLYKRERRLPITENLHSLPFLRLNNIFIDKLSKSKKIEFFEIGCAPGSWMHYFHTVFGYQVYGLDYTNNAIEISKRNLDYLNIKSTLIKSNILKYKNDIQYDVVFSAGFIEHFRGKMLDDIIKIHVNLTKPRGLIIIIVPNLNGINKYIQTILDRRVLNIHNDEVMNLKYFENISKEYKLKIIFNDYVGGINFGLFSGNIWLLRIGYLFQIIIDWLSRLLNISFRDCKWWSPYIVTILKK